MIIFLEQLEENKNLGILMNKFGKVASFKNRKSHFFIYNFENKSFETQYMHRKMTLNLYTK